MYPIKNNEQSSGIQSGQRARRRLTPAGFRHLIVVMSCSFFVSAPAWASDGFGRAQALVAAAVTDGESNKVGPAVTRVSATQALAQDTVPHAPNDVAQLVGPEALNMDVVKVPMDAVRHVESTAVASATSVALVVTSAATDASNTVLDAAGAIQHGIASWYGAQFQNRRTASGERFNMIALTAAHRTLPFGTRLCAHSPSTGKSVIVRINDRGPFIKDRVIDFSRAAAQALGILHSRPDVVALLDSSDKRCSKD